MSETDWYAWHERYAEPSSPLAERLALVQRRLAEALDACPPGALHLVSLCAGQGADVLPVLAAHQRGRDVAATLVELDPRNVDATRATAARAGLDTVTVRRADAGLSATYAGLPPAHVVVACGVLGNMTETDVERTVRALPSLGSPGATVLWTRHRRPPDLTPAIRRWFVDAGCTEVTFDAPDSREWTVGVVRGPDAPAPCEVHGERWFTFVPRTALGTL